MTGRKWPALLVGVVAVMLVVAAVVAGSQMGYDSPLVGPIPPGWTTPQEITGEQSTGGRGVPASTVAP